MKLHMNPVSTTSRSVLLLFAEHGIPHEAIVVDLMTGEHMRPPYTELNPSAQVPTLVDGDFVLTECSAILKYVADKHDLPVYPKDPQRRARVNERMDWFNTGFYRELAYHLVYPQVFGHHVRSPELAQAATIEWGREKAQHWLGLLDRAILGKNAYVCGDEISIADYLGAEYAAAGDLIRVDVSAFPNVNRWMTSMRALPSWKKVHEAADGFAASLREKPFVSIGG